MCKSCDCKYISKKLYGYCDGFFSKDSWSDKVIEAIGSDWVIVRDSYSNKPDFAEFENPKQRDEYLTKWMKEEDNNT